MGNEDLVKKNIILQQQMFQLPKMAASELNKSFSILAKQVTKIPHFIEHAAQP